MTCAGSKKGTNGAQCPTCKGAGELTERAHFERCAAQAIEDAELCEAASGRAAQTNCNEQSDRLQLQADGSRRVAEFFTKCAAEAVD